MSGDPISSDPARKRFFTLQACRWAGMVLAIVGLLALNGRGLPKAVGYVLFPAGLITALIVPVLLARRWRSPRP